MAEKSSKLPAGAGSEDAAALAASGREAKVKTAEDKKLIKKLFDLVPLDWARYPDGKLVFLAPNGSKASYTQQQLDDLQAEKKPPAKKSKPSA